MQGRYIHGASKDPVWDSQGQVLQVHGKASSQLLSAIYEVRHVVFTKSFILRFITIIRKWLLKEH